MSEVECPYCTGKRGGIEEKDLGDRTLYSCGCGWFVLKNKDNK